jgi:hypothetical protein
MAPSRQPQSGPAAPDSAGGKCLALGARELHGLLLEAVAHRRGLEGERKATRDLAVHGLQPATLIAVRAVVGHLSIQGLSLPVVQATQDLDAEQFLDG